ncbi:MAG TPA: hypothetical protein VFW25_15290 [Silvibacterium sp.]|nr:hypothetical protein [Silvibacterium sp.]
MAGNSSSGISTSKISTNWSEPEAIEKYSTGVSLHSHTSASEETLDFIQEMGLALPGGRIVARYYERVCRKKYGLKLDFARGNWRPPLQPRMAYELEKQQIERMGLTPLISITDHDTIAAAVLLRTMPSSRHIPMSVEWSAPFGRTIFHLGIHNLPSADAAEWMRRFKSYTAAPDDAKLLAILRELHEQRQVMIVFNHPMWDLYNLGRVHVSEVRRFIAEAGDCVHALELNGLRHAKENQETERLADETGHLMISGGDRHGMEPNAILNLTSAKSFTEFVDEIRVERLSHVHFMDQYQQKWEHRILRSTVDAVTDFPQFVPGWQRWDERAFHPDAQGTMRPLRELWPKGKPPLGLMTAIRFVRVWARYSCKPESWMAPGVEAGMGAQAASRADTRNQRVAGSRLSRPSGVEP